MWKKLMFGIIIGVMLMTVSAGVIYGAQINPASPASNSSSVLAGNGKGDGNGENRNGTGDCDGTGDCINEDGTDSGNGSGSGNGTGPCNGTGDCINENGNGSGNGTGECTNENCTGDCDGTGECTNENCTGDCDGTGDCTNMNCTGDCNEGLMKQNGQQQNANGIGAENKKTGLGYAESNQNKNVERYEKSFSFRNAFARFLSFFKFGNNS